MGLGKMKLLEQQYGEIGIDVMRNIKLALDPKNLMNPGKIFTTRWRSSESSSDKIEQR